MAKKKTCKKFAMALSLCAILLYALFGAGTSLAWFTDTSEELTNIFHFADFEVAVSHRLEDGTWEDIDGQTDIFDDEALYEPGYVQVVYLKIENKGDRAFDYQTAVTVTRNNTPSTNVFGQQFFLQDYLKFGVTVAATEADMDRQVEDRELAKKLATMDLQRYDSVARPLEPERTAYMALVVYMPESVGNEANYRGVTVPKVELGIIVKADQQKN